MKAITISLLVIDVAVWGYVLKEAVVLFVSIL
jgi:hypothetical protein